MVPWQTGGAPSIWSRSPNLQVRIALPTKVNPGRHWYLIISPIKKKRGASDKQEDDGKNEQMFQL